MMNSEPNRKDGKSTRRWKGVSKRMLTLFDEYYSVLKEKSSVGAKEFLQDMDWMELLKVTEFYGQWNAEDFESVQNIVKHMRAALEYNRKKSDESIYILGKEWTHKIDEIKAIDKSEHEKEDTYFSIPRRPFDDFGTKTVLSVTMVPHHNGPKK